MSTSRCAPGTAGFFGLGEHPNVTPELLTLLGGSIPGGPTATLNQGRFFIALKPRDRRRDSAMEIINHLQPQLAKIEGIALYMQPAQDITIGGRLNKTQYQYTLNDADSNVACAMPEPTSSSPRLGCGS